MKVLVLGGAGYIGEVLCSYLKEKGYEVIVYDNLLYGEKKIDIVGDIRDIDKLSLALEQADAIIHLAGLSMDLLNTMGSYSMWDINYKANETISQLLRNTGKRIIYASSGSVYGIKEGISKETSLLRPLTLYAKTKALSEELYLHKDLNSIILRFATAYGVSNSQRLDTVTNHMIADSYFKKKITVNGSNRYRAIIHIKDLARGIELALKTKKNKYKIYNLGADNQNYQLGKLAVLIQKQTGAKIIIDDSSNDKRSYVINYERIKNDLSFRPQYRVEDAIQEFYEIFKRGIIKNMDNIQYYRIKYLEKYGSL